MVYEKRILITSRLHAAGGVETHLLGLCRLLVQRGAEVTVVSRYAKKSVPLVQLSGVIPIRLITTPFAQNLRWFRLSTAWALLFWPVLLRKNRFDVLYTLELSAFTKFLVRFLTKKGQVILNRAGEPFKESDELPKDARSLLSGLIVESELQADAARKSFGTEIPVAAIPHLGLSADLPEWKPRAFDGMFRVSFLGRYDVNKGIFRLLDIWEKLEVAEAQLDFYGHGPEQGRLESEILRRGLSKTVRVNGGWDDAVQLTEILGKTDLVVLPSKTEGLPVVLLEAMAHGVPFVATDVGAVRTLAVNNPDVLVVPNSDGEIKEAIERMARAIRLGEVPGDRLQAYHRSRYGMDILSKRWLKALLAT